MAKDWVEMVNSAAGAEGRLGPFGSEVRDDVGACMTTKVVVDVASSGEHYELEATTAGGSGINDAFLAAIA